MAREKETEKVEWRRTRSKRKKLKLARGERTMKKSNEREAVARGERKHD